MENWLVVQINLLVILWKLIANIEFVYRRIKLCNYESRVSCTISKQGTLLDKTQLQEHELEASVWFGHKPQNWFSFPLFYGLFICPVGYWISSVLKVHCLIFIGIWLKQQKPFLLVPQCINENFTQPPPNNWTYFSYIPQSICFTIHACSQLKQQYTHLCD